MEADVILNIEDFSVPSIDDTVQALEQTFKILREDKIIYVGCMGGIGRTGMFMTLIAAVAAVDRLINPPPKSFFGQIWARVFGLSIYKTEPKWVEAVRSDPISYIRSSYMTYAVETEEQKKFVRLFPIMEKIMLIKPNGTTYFK